MCLVSFDDRVSAVSVCGSGRLCGGGAPGGVQEAEEMCVGVGDANHYIHTLVHNTRKVGEQDNLRGRDL